MNTITRVCMRYVSGSLIMEDVKHTNAKRSRLENQFVVKQVLKEYRSAASTTHYTLPLKQSHGILKTKSQKKFAGSLVMAGIHVSNTVKIIQGLMLSLIHISEPTRQAEISYA